MTLLRGRMFVLPILFAPLMLSAQTPAAAIEDVLNRQAVAWNKGDLEQFVNPYADRCTLVGTQISEVTRAEVLAHYQTKYPSRAAMGKLTFSGLTVNPLDERIAMVTGHWHLDRNAASGGSVGGVFSLVFELSNGTWKIVLDHTS
ncbi:MAG: nuclear transport factor 2 family protein [Bryobacteraceae bacterium]